MNEEILEGIELSFTNGFVGWDYDDIDIKESSILELNSMLNLMTNASLEISRELQKRGH